MNSEDPSRWSLSDIASLDPEALHVLTQRAAGSLTRCRVLLGRCLMAIDGIDANLHYGCHSSIHYANTVLGMEDQEARDCRRVAERLEDLPILRRAADRGEVGWCALREVVRRATPDDEAYWLEAAQTMTMRRLERLLRQREEGSEGPTQEADRVELRVTVPAEFMVLLQRAVRRLSEQEGRPVGVVPVLECALAELLAGPDPDEQRRLAEEVRRDLAAEQTPWAAVAAEETPCPDEPELQVVSATVPAWENPKLSFNPESRLATPAQRSQILRRDGYRCSTPGCNHTLWLHVHHLSFYCQGGATVPDNLLVLCSACHRNLHRGHLAVRGQVSQGLDWRDSRLRVLGHLALPGPADWIGRWLWVPLHNRVGPGTEVRSGEARTLSE